jgi:hypothetical protein
MHMLLILFRVKEITWPDADADAWQACCLTCNLVQRAVEPRLDSFRAKSGARSCVGRIGILSTRLSSL